MPGLRRPLGYAATVLRDRPIGLWRLNLAGRALGQESSGHSGLYTPVINGSPLYGDGVARGSATGTVADQTLSLQIAANPGNQQWPGSLQYVALYDYALSAARVQAHYQARLSAIPLLGPSVYSIVSGG